MRLLRPGHGFVHPDWRVVLGSLELKDIEDWLTLEKHAVDQPNHRWGGAGEVFRSCLTDIEGRPQQVYIKYQRDQRRRSPRHPLRGEPTYQREFRNLMRCYLAGVPVAEPVYFRNVRRAGHDDTLLVMKGLDDYQGLDRVEPVTLSGRQRQRMIRDVAAAVATLHAAGFSHQNLYAKHVFVAWREAQQRFDVRFIDLEKCRRHFGFRRFLYRDLETLARHSPRWSRVDQVRFLRCYLGGAPLDGAGREWARGVGRLARRKREG